jgi:predicted Zn-dependent protease
MNPAPDYGLAREYLQKGLSVCPENPLLWRLAIRLEESVRGITKARSMADQARLRLPKNELVRLLCAGVISDSCQWIPCNFCRSG